MLNFLLAFSLLSFVVPTISADEIEILDLDVISYESFINNDEYALSQLRKALLQKGIVGVRGIPEYQIKVRAFIEAARCFTLLPETLKDQYAPDHEKGEMFLGYEAGKERFKRPDGEWVVDDLKVSYYGLVPESNENKWPKEIDLKTPFQELGMLMANMGESVMGKIGLVGPATGIYVNKTPKVGRMLYYRKNENSAVENPFWCGSHFDHGLFTALLPAFYFKDGELIDEPLEAGLFVNSEGKFKKVISDDPDVMMFQVGEFGQLATNDRIKATEHRVHKAAGWIERYTMALFFDAPVDTVIRSTSVLTQDERYGGKAGEKCSYAEWQKGSFERYIVK